MSDFVASLRGHQAMPGAPGGIGKPGIRVFVSMGFNVSMHQVQTSILWSKSVVGVSSSLLCSTPHEAGLLCGRGRQHAAFLLVPAVPEPSC